MAATSETPAPGGQWLSILSAGFLVVLVSYSGPLLIYLQAAQAMGASAETFSSWIFAISMGAAVTSIGLSAWLRAPVATAWSAPGTALLISIGARLPFAEVVGAFLVAAAVILALGITGLFDRLVAAIPRTVADGMMAGILFGFGVHAMGGLAEAPAVVAILLLAYFAVHVRAPRFTMLVLLGLGLGLSWAFYDVRPDSVGLALAAPEIVWPRFSLEACLGLALPLTLTTLTGQFLPGFAILRVNGYEVAARPVLVACSLASLAGAFLGGVTTALAAITQALCASPDAHPDASRRWLAGVAAGAFFGLGGIFAGSIGRLLTLLPGQVIAMLAGLALLGAIQRSLSDMLKAPEDPQAGLVTFIVTVSGVSLWGVGSAFWGLVAGAAAVAVARALRPASRP